MKLQEWREQQKKGEQATLPSGLEIYVKRVGLLDLAEWGQIPQTLTPKIDELMRAGTMNTVTLNQVAEFAEVINLVCRACVVGPEGLDITELSYADRLSVFNWASQAVAHLQSFRKPFEESL